MSQRKAWNEEEIISLFSRESRQDGSLPPAFQDDCALLNASTLLTTDSMVENTHFRLATSTPESLAMRLFHSNLSDVISSGGDAIWMLLNLGLPNHLPYDWPAQFATELLNQAELFRVPLLGGDTFRAPYLHLSLTMGGKVARHLTRAGAKRGDSLYVTGTPGLSLLGFLQLNGKIELADTILEKQDRAQFTSPEWNPEYPISIRSAAIKRHQSPTARVRWGQILRDDPYVSAMMDLSDGILADLPRMARASRLLVQVNLEKLPIPSPISSFLTPEFALAGGEDYELLFFAKGGFVPTFPCTQIGVAIDNHAPGKVEYLDHDVPLQPSVFSFSHFPSNMMKTDPYL